MVKGITERGRKGLGRKKSVEPHPKESDQHHLKGEGVVQEKGTRRRLSAMVSQPRPARNRRKRGKRGARRRAFTFTEASGASQAG